MPGALISLQIALCIKSPYIELLKSIRSIWGTLLITKFALKLELLPLKHALVLQWNEK